MQQTKKTNGAEQSKKLGRSQTLNLLLWHDTGRSELHAELIINLLARARQQQTNAAK